MLETDRASLPCSVYGISAIDAMATFLTGERYYFSAGGSLAGDSAREQDARARESGEKPWRT